MVLCNFSRNRLTLRATTSPTQSHPKLTCTLSRLAGSQGAKYSLEVTQTVFSAYKHLSRSKELRHSLVDEASGCFYQRKEKPYETVEGGSGFQRALKRAPDHYMVFFSFLHVHSALWANDSARRPVLKFAAKRN